MQWTERQKNAIDDRNANLLVSAAAGSGKTAVLVERVKQLLLSEHVSLEDMLVVTFTNAAASEMKEKIYKSLNKAFSTSVDDPDRQRFLRDQLSVIGRANISTFHKFAIEIIHRYYHTIGVKPNLKILDEPRQNIMQQEAVDEELTALFDSGDTDFLNFLDTFCDARSNKTAIDMILDFHKFLQSLPDPEEWLKDARACNGQVDKLHKLSLSMAVQNLRMAIRYFRMIKEMLERGVGDQPLIKLAAKMDSDIAITEALIKDIESDSLLDAEFPTLARLVASKEEKPLYETIKDEVSELRTCGTSKYKQAKAFIAMGQTETLKKETALSLKYIETLCRLTEDFGKRYNAKKEKLGVMDFSDIEHFALKILKNDDVCNEYRERFRYIFVDEYQDSNLVQESLIQRICRPNNLFMVGDVKQSIYKFRLAEPELFISKYGDYKAGRLPDSRVIDLNSNFRSKGPVISTVNELFSGIMNKDNTGLAYDDDAALVQGSPYNGPNTYEPRLFVIDTGPAVGEDKEIAELKSVELEALNAANVIREYYGNVIHDDKDDVDRPLVYRDMVILLRSVKGAGEVFYKTLTDADIPVFLDRSEGYFDTMEIQVFLNLLKLINNKQQDIPLLSILRSPIFGFSSRELAEIRVYASDVEMERISYNKAFRLYANAGDDLDLRQKCNRFLEKLSLWRYKATYMPLCDFLWELMVSTGYSDFTSSIPGGEQRLANLRSLVDKAKSFEKENAKGLFGFISYIEAMAATGKVKIGQVKILSEGANAVRIMTIHKSKGLEFPFVLLAGLGKRNMLRMSNLPVEFHKELGIGIMLANTKTRLKLKTGTLLLIGEKKKAEDAAEIIRVLYVALTRPKDILLLSGTTTDAQSFVNESFISIPGDPNTFNTYLSMIGPVMKSLKPTIITRADISVKKKAFTADRTMLQKCLEQGFPVDGLNEVPTDRELTSRLSFEYSKPDENREKRKYSVSQLAALERLNLKALGPVLSTDEHEADEHWQSREYDSLEADVPVPAFVSPRTELTAAERGTAYHTVMEHIPFTAEGKDVESVKAFIDGLCAEKILTEDEGAAVDPAAIAGFFSSDIGKRALLSKEIYKEAPFVMKSVHDGRDIMVQGTIDCYFREGDSYVLLDYKSSYVSRDKKAEALARLKETYIPQLKLYRTALESITGTGVKEGVLYLFGIGEELVVE